LRLMTLEPELSVVEPGIRGPLFDFGAAGVGEANAVHEPALRL
jgi:hypothetical protein